MSSSSTTQITITEPVSLPSFMLFRTKLTGLEIRSLFLNLKDKGNPGLRDKIVIGTLPAEHVVNMSKEVS
jgi:hypothetical protein